MMLCDKCKKYILIKLSEVFHIDFSSDCEDFYPLSAFHVSPP